jgi:type IV fimbrial biogenesis protein FimT
MNRSNHLTQRGFTLTELLVSLAIVSVLLGTAAPAVGSFFSRMKLGSMATDLVANLHVARGESIKSRTRVVLCKSRDGATCAATGGWEQGWIVFRDADNDGVRDASETLVNVMGALPAGWRIAGNANVARYVSYDPSGGTRLASGAFQVGTLTVCRASAGPTEARQVVLNIAGRPRIEKTSVARCI